MTDRPRLLIATHSAHKLAELRELLELERGELVSLDDLGIADDPVETGETFETNARIKARFGARRTGLPTLADDSGLEVDALRGAPGVRTRRYAGPRASDEDNNRKLLRALDGLPPEQRGARYVCVLALALPVHTVGGAAVGVVAEGEERGDVAVGDEPDVAAGAAVTAVGPALGDVRLAPEGDAARATIACLHMQAALVDEP